MTLLMHVADVLGNNTFTVQKQSYATVALHHLGPLLLVLLWCVAVQLKRKCTSMSNRFH